jgi:hypothetical protein
MADEKTVAAVGKVSEALEYVHRVRGAFYELHQLMGRADFLFGDAAVMLRAAGHHGLAELIDTHLVGRDVLPGHWTFQVVEEFDETYYFPVVDVEQRVRDELTDGERHRYESRLKQRRQSA